ncbi:hypothetical protein TA05_10390 [Citrobacter rodentium]|nr:hypothetical protein TA05_10390 [Citrobacter rodentium]
MKGKTTLSIKQLMSMLSDFSFFMGRYRYSGRLFLFIIFCVMSAREMRLKKQILLTLLLMLYPVTAMILLYIKSRNAGYGGLAYDMSGVLFFLGSFIANIIISLKSKKRAYINEQIWLYPSPVFCGLWLIPV